MYNIKIFILALSYCLVCTAHAQTLYKWVDKQGKITYSDRPAPAGEDVMSLTTQVNALSTPSSPASDLPFELAQRVNKSPVVLYAAKGCQPCDDGRVLLRKRGVPFTEKWLESESDLNALMTKFSSTTLPVLSIGEASKTGYSSIDWDLALDQAGYPRDNQLPKTFVTGKVEKLTAPASSSTQVKPSQPQPASNPVVPTANPEDQNIQPTVRF